MAIDLEKLVWDIMSAPAHGLPADPEACAECRFHPSNLQHENDDGGYCYMFKELPPTLCMQFKSKEH